ncbi:alpha/beta fold hydrolase [Plantactinospora sp. KBS50]|uniref:alpha/beta fold hydrolase n=1 Tax=Plantactinospora sp. KBS50 TaxID=2024580 RepID=UPI001E575E41|nr:alpha/beta hydrolase [Plantactinospora sp. KBS50]
MVENAGIRRLLESTYTEALRQGPYGWIDDMLALRRPWKFSVSDILVPMLLWHGADDEFSPVRHTQWLAERIPGSIIEVQPGKAHFAAVEVLPKILAWLAEPAPAPAPAPVPTAEPS